MVKVDERNEFKLNGMINSSRNEKHFETRVLILFFFVCFNRRSNCHLVAGSHKIKYILSSRSVACASPGAANCSFCAVHLSLYANHKIDISFGGFCSLHLTD